MRDARRMTFPLRTPYANPHAGPVRRRGEQVGSWRVPVLRPMEYEPPPFVRQLGMFIIMGGKSASAPRCFYTVPRHEGGREAFAKGLANAMQAAGYKLRSSVLFRLFNSRYRGQSVSFQSVSCWLGGCAFPVQDQAASRGDPAWDRVACTSLRNEDAIDVYLSMTQSHRKPMRKLIVLIARLERQASLPGMAFVFGGLPSHRHPLEVFMDLSKLSVDGGVRQRGEQVTRLETFVDAAFAFAVTLLVVSFDAMPDTFAELYEALRRLPAFLAGFAILALFWHGHHRFSRNFGLEDGTIVFLSMALVAATMFYVYPLRMVMSAAMMFFTGGWAPSEFKVSNMTEFRLIFVIYGVGFAVLAAIIAWMNAHALRKAGQLQLDAAEKLAVRAEVIAHLALIGCALLSVVLALAIPEGQGWMHALPGLAYGLLGLLMPVMSIHYGRRVQALAAQRETG